MKRFAIITVMLLCQLVYGFGGMFPGHSIYVRDPYSADETDALLALYLKLDTSNDPLQGDLDFDTFDIFASDALNFKVSGDNDDYLSFLTSSNTPTIDIIGGNFFNITSESNAPGIRLFEDSSNFMIFGWTGDDAIVGSTQDLNIATASNNGNITLSPHGTGDIKLGSLTSNGFVKTGSGDGTTFVDTNTYYTQDEVNNLVEGNTFDFFLNNTLSGIGSPEYFTMDATETGEGESTFFDTITGDAFLIDSFVTTASQPTFTDLVVGIYSLHVHAETTVGVNVRTTRLFWELYSRLGNSPFTETLLLTSEESDTLTDSDTEYNMHGSLTAGVMLNATDRLLVKVYGNIEDGDPPRNTDPVVTLRAEGTTFSHMEVVTNVTAFDDRYVFVTGDTMTGPLNMGGNNIPNVGLIDGLDMTALLSATPGTVVLNKAVIAGPNKDISSFRNLGLTGILTIGSSSILESGGDDNLTLNSGGENINMSDPVDLRGNSIFGIDDLTMSGALAGATSLSVSGPGTTQGSFTSTNASGGICLIAKTGQTFDIRSLPSDAGILPGGLAIVDVTDNANRFVIDTLGKIGIGTNIPEAKLHVVGTIKGTDTVTFTGVEALGADPEIAGQLWNDGGTVKISSGPP